MRVEFWIAKVPVMDPHPTSLRILNPQTSRKLSTESTCVNYHVYDYPQTHQISSLFSLKKCAQRNKRKFAAVSIFRSGPDHFFFWLYYVMPGIISNQVEVNIMLIICWVYKSILPAYRRNPREKLKVCHFIKAWRIRFRFYRVRCVRAKFIQQYHIDPTLEDPVRRSSQIRT